MEQSIPAQATPPTPPIPLPRAETATELAPSAVLGTPRVALLGFKNNFPVTLTYVQLTHQYGTATSEPHVWWNVGPGQLTSPPLEAHYETGPFTDSDFWSLEFQFHDGKTFSVSDYKCNMREEDNKDVAGIIYSYVDGWTFNPGLKSGCSGVIVDKCEDSRFNCYAFVKIDNKFPVHVTAKLYHHYSNYPDDLKDFGSVASGTSTEHWPVYYLSGTGHTDTDHWNVNLVMEAEPPSNSTTSRSEDMVNETRNKTCALYASDAGKNVTLVVDGAGLHIDIPSGPGFDKWLTPLKYNTVAFIRIKNACQQGIIGAVLKHRYSSDKTYEFDFGIIDQDKTSDDMFMVEYFTGSNHPGFDYWTLAVYLLDRTWYTSSIEKQCYLTTSDANSTILFTVSETKLILGLDGPCEDSMTKSHKTFDILLGADPDKPYNENCFLAAHNAFANHAEGYYLAPNQIPSIRKQLFEGVTTLLIDLWEYDNDIYMLHEWGSAGRLANDPWAKYVSLLEGLKEIGRFIKQFPYTVITIVIEDRLSGAMRPKIQDRFTEAKIDHLLYMPTTPNAWPDLKNLFGKIVVFTNQPISNPNKLKIMYQWNYMTENNYGSKSLDAKTWVQQRKGSQRLGSLPLLAMNHFPDIPTFMRVNWSTMLHCNTKVFLKQHIDEFDKVRPPRLIPNFVNVDFFELGDCIWAVKYCNSKLHGLPPPP